MRFAHYINETLNPTPPDPPRPGQMEKFCSGNPCKAFTKHLRKMRKGKPVDVCQNCGMESPPAEHDREPMVRGYYEYP